MACMKAADMSGQEGLHPRQHVAKHIDKQEGMDQGRNTEWRGISLNWHWPAVPAHGPSRQLGPARQAIPEALAVPPHCV